MDVAYNQHSPHYRRHGRSSTNLNHLSLAPLTSRFPIDESEDAPYPVYQPSYLEGRSAPTTPSVLSKSLSRVSLGTTPGSTLSKSKSSTHLVVRRTRHGLPRSMPPGSKPRRGVARDEGTLSSKDRNDSDWLLRAGALMSNSARESKGQSWLVSRASSTSLTAQRDEDEEAFERELARERVINSRRGSNAGAFDADDEFSPVTTRRSLSFGPGSHPASRYGSRAQSRRGSRGRSMTPHVVEREGYFDHLPETEEFVAEPDFVDVEEEGYDYGDAAKEDEAMVKKLTKAGSLGLGGWVEKMLGWNLFAVDEDAEESDMESDEDEEEAEHSESHNKDDKDDAVPLPQDKLPPPDAEDAGGWQDAAWLLSVASKVLL
ncbi:hypothetical protein F5884DRAFT_766902 [Xylogone sp. PMI_703]|nr:hypothetical protein F5884DRAFT_766902 [Xylogone sp. PMI_703]